MFQIFISTFLSFISMVALANQWGEKLKIATLNSNPVIELEYSYHPSQVFWSLRYKSTLTADKIASLPNKIRFKLVNLNTNQVFFEQLASKETLLSPSLVYGNDLNLFVKKFLTEQTNFVLAFADADDQALYYLPIADICSQYPGNVFNRSHPLNSACVVNASEFSHEPNACLNQKDMLKEYISHGWMTCNSAQDIWNYIECDKVSICTP
jgi:hypothetical protein